MSHKPIRASAPFLTKGQSSSFGSGTALIAPPAALLMQSKEAGRPITTPVQPAAIRRPTPSPPAVPQVFQLTTPVATAQASQLRFPLRQPRIRTDGGGAETDAGTDAYETFHGFADMAGVIQYGSDGW